MIFTYGLFSKIVDRFPVTAPFAGGLLFVGWFGPRGIASVLYLVLVVNMPGVEGYERVLSVIVLTVLLSVFLHGVSALPLSQLYGRTSKQAG